MNKPYVSITGFTTPQEVKAVEAPVMHGYDVFLAVLTRHETLAGLGATSRFPNRDMFERTLNAIECQPNVQPAVHYCFSDRDIPHLEQDLGLILRHPIHALQLNTVSTKALREAVHIIARAAVQPYLIFQLNNPVMNRFKLNAGKAIQFFSASVPVNDTAYILLDLSAGHGRPMDYETAGAVKMVCGTFKNVRFAVAGGIKPNTVDEVIEVMGYGVSVDAETHLRDAANDVLNPQKVHQFLRSAAWAVEKVAKKG